jgi:hypothetical protein
MKAADNSVVGVEGVPVWTPWGMQMARKLSPFARRLAALERLNKIRSSSRVPATKPVH